MSLNALFIGSSGLTTNSSALDVIGNNLANLNTTGFKSQRMLFKDVVYQTINSGSTATNSVGGTNPTQFGFGVGTGSIGTMFAQGNLNPTGRNLDAGIQGSGFFVLKSSNSVSYSRAGGFDVDAAGYLVDPSTGFRVQRFGAVGEGTATTPAFQTPGNLDIQIPFGTGVAGFATTNVSYQGNLSTSMQVGDVATTAIQVYDSQSTPRALTVTFTKTAANTYSATATVSGGTATVTGGPITFNTAGQLVSPATLTVALSGIAGAAATQNITLDLGTPLASDGLSQFGGATTASAVNQDGAGFGTLTDVSIGSDGVLSGKFSNGRTLSLAQLAIAGFNNEGGLIRTGNNYFQSSVSSGEALVGVAGQGGRGTLVGGSLEASNVDIASEFAKLIIAQRGFEVNAKTVSTTSDTLQSLVAILR
ncbi:flagellar hook protein : Flagellar hook-basal body protein OS=Cellulomonas fimi (strain ATCC 484 / DSM 20113 / JCM 1341 / NBRC 15513 / NCIMB 8980 / NCTC 7547) GN=Celf_0679 PE=4 SV=1: Flg_bb_rod: FlaE: Flg_bbr_C [Gemmata massiliana]|uniref:Flagellar hook protein FlgE n=1 Tax=Gemmata massiliana TaxID=1210884 RepID=A0A6P2D8C3_9BACT|nr:flagellar hook protein FlgE [Gemmata massiliana]VTR96384.1 flagellar hook protein : Flagellar hook-basal body protein OS=Cellulomonas fimi (strain ATCC 484 / DSM 20113 / JCM 1341 / NBRC 15513 / NCIMB 8980 / NCTC 7547) GN=Celf_0679 PE=4 SV=1: Flg_bb_rod: FlaE: Flg_bbr_C [Gemmata massiliana]